MKISEIYNEEYSKNGRYIIRAITYEQNHIPLHKLRAFLAIPEVRKELEKLQFVIKNTPIQHQANIPISKIVHDLLLKHNFSISPKSKELIYNFLKENDQYLEEESPNTLEGSFTNDLIISKQWLCDILKKGLKDHNAQTIYILGSWYGNLALFLKEAGINFDKLVLVDIDEKVLKFSEELLRPFFDVGQLVFLNVDACDIIYDHPGIVINTSVNDMSTDWYKKVPKNILTIVQGRDSVSSSYTKISDMKQFVDMFPMSKTYYTGKKVLTDPKIDYSRYMKIGLK